MKKLKILLWKLGKGIIYEGYWNDTIFKRIINSLLYLKKKNINTVIYLII